MGKKVGILWKPFGRAGYKLPEKTTSFLFLP
jgi:hypothetical protein